MSKWTEFRKNRDKSIDKYVNLKKNMIRVKMINTLIQMVSVFKSAQKNYKIIQERKNY